MQVARVAADWPVPSLMHRRRVVGDRITYIGLDVHKEGIAVAVAEGGGRGEVREYGRIANTPAALDRLVRKLGHESVALDLKFANEVATNMMRTSNPPR
jgi:hypothetical protein